MKKLLIGTTSVVLVSCLGYYSYKFGKDIREAIIECNKLNLK